MQAPSLRADDKHRAAGFDLDNAIERIAHWLPTQGPIKDFIHHNTLHAVQHHPFHEGVAIAAKMFGAHSYLPISAYQERYRQGRIKDYAVDWALDYCRVVPQRRREVREMLFQPDRGEHYPPHSLANHGIRNAWLNRLGINLNAMVQPVLFRLLSNFLDQGISRWTLPKDGESFWECVNRLVHKSWMPLYPFKEPAVRDLLRTSPDNAIAACLREIVGSEELHEQYLLEMLLSHPGWSGMVHVIETNPQALLLPRAITLKELIAVELCCESAFLHLKKKHPFIRVDEAAHAAQPVMLDQDGLQGRVPLRMKIWHEAMEYSLHTELLLALKSRNRPPSSEKTPLAQALFCIDDRECSLRRYLEETHPGIETFGAAGFFGVDFLYQGLDDAYPVAQCPVVITPRHLIREAQLHPESDKKKAAAGGFADMHFTSHSMWRGWLFTQTLGLGYAARLAWNVFFPNSQLLKIKSLSEVEAHTRLHLLRENDEPNEAGQLLGFSYVEMADKIEGLLRNIGLTQNFAALVVVVAHGSSSVNNPHFAAYDCGACSGKPGAPNARAFAWMANDDTVRGLLRARGIDIPPTTHFVAALHNTSRDEITYFDQYLLDQKPIPGLATFQHAMEQALQKNAGERCRWFELGPQFQSDKKAHEHVIARASSIFEPRPELNHSNNLYCIVGRRNLSNGLFLDRRAFLHSYDPASDANGAILVKILSALIPVCGGINLEYLFSRVDNSVYGAGTKLPHNVIGLLGVANGVEGDLRTGLPSQMIEVHEPARLMFVIEQNPEIVDKALPGLGVLKEWLDNEWVRLVCCRPDTHDLHYYSSEGWRAVDLPADAQAPTAIYSKNIIAGKTDTIPAHVMERRY